MEELKQPSPLVKQEDQQAISIKNPDVVDLLGEEFDGSASMPEQLSALALIWGDMKPLDHAHLEKRLSVQIVSLESIFIGLLIGANGAHLSGGEIALTNLVLKVQDNSRRSIQER